jgi:hypothetical protein
MLKQGERAYAPFPPLGFIGRIVSALAGGRKGANIPTHSMDLRAR